MFGRKHLSALATLCATVALGLIALGAAAQNQALSPQRGFDPSRPEDRAFDPNSQNVPFHASVQRPPLRLIAIVPVTSGLGTNVPVLNLEAPALRLNQDQRWVIDLVATNNTSLTLSPEIRCTFMNGGKPVETVSVFLEGLGAGQKVYFNIYGPKGEIFVDHSPCQVAQPGRLP